MKTKVAEFWKLPDSMANAKEVICYRLCERGEGKWQWSHVDSKGRAHCIYKKVEK